MKIRMLFGTIVEIGGERVDLKNDTIVDVPAEVAEALLGSRAELVDEAPAEPVLAPEPAPESAPEIIVDVPAPAPKKVK